ncbi:MAG: flagellar hook-length control protein FliK [Burkholderiales bacterium]
MPAIPAITASSPAASNSVAAVAGTADADVEGIQIVLDGTELMNFEEVLAAHVTGKPGAPVSGADEPPASAEVQVLPEFLVAQLAPGMAPPPAMIPQGQALPAVQARNLHAAAQRTDALEIAIEVGGRADAKGKLEPATPVANSPVKDELIAAAASSPGANPLEPGKVEVPATDGIRAVGAAAPHDVQKSTSTPRPSEVFNPRHIPEPVKSPGWGEALGQRIVWMAKENLHVVHLQVEPPNLGPVEVQMVLNRDHATLVFASPHAAVRDAISESLSRLDSSLAAGGLTLGGVSVNSQSQSQQHERSSGHSGEPVAAWNETEAVAEVAPPRVRVNIGLVDTFA